MHETVSSGVCSTDIPSTSERTSAKESENEDSLDLGLGRVSRVSDDVMSIASAGES